jgi:hypothetical protein
MVRFRMCDRSGQWPNISKAYHSWSFGTIQKTPQLVLSCVKNKLTFLILNSAVLTIFLSVEVKRDTAHPFDPSGFGVM